MPPKRKRAREPVQAYLDRADLDLLEELGARMSLSKAEVIRQGIRRMAQELDRASRPGAGLSSLLGALDSAESVPIDLAARHDDYLYGHDESSAPSGR